MANQFIGLHMLVILRDPPARLKGTVSGIEAGNSLTLSNVWLLDTREWRPRMKIDANNVLELSEVPDEAQAHVPAPLQSITIPQTASTIPPPAQQPIPRKPSHVPFVDPAILSIGKRPEPLGNQGLHSQSLASANETRGLQTAGAAVQIEDGAEDLTPTGLVSESLKELKVENRRPIITQVHREATAPAPEADATAPLAPPTGPKKKRRQRRGKDASGTVLVHDEGTHAIPANRGKGWRQTPILQSAESFQPFNSLKPRSRGRHARPNDNGWASEDVTDVQEMGDFDFESSLAKFDKDGLFDQMRKEDKTDDADRLVSHNRQQARPKAGTAGGKNLHYSENVLDVPATTSRQSRDAPANDFWNSEADEGIRNGAERLSGREQGSRQSSRRGDSKVSTTRRSQSRKASAVPPALAPPRVNNSSHPNSATSQGLYLLPSNRRVETVSALQMLNLENIAHNELGLTDEMMTENAGRGIAEVALTTLSDPAIKVRIAGSADPATGNVPPHTIVILAGNNKSGARAVAAGRHLRNKGINVLVCIVGMDRGLDGSLLDEMRQQVRLFKNFGGRIFNKAELFEHIRKASIPTLTIDAPRSTIGPLANPAPVTLIVDALLGLAVSFEELRTSDQASVYELIEWTNRNEAFVLAVDVPTGIDPSTGKIAIIDGGRLYVKPRYVVSVAAPKRGLLEAMIASDDAGSSADDVLSAAEWKLFVADVGFGAGVWKKAGTKIRRGIEFGERWVCEMRYRGGSGEGGGVQ